MQAETLETKDNREVPRHRIDEKAFQRALEKHYPLTKLAKDAGVNYNTVRHAMSKHGNRLSLDTMHMGTFIKLCDAMGMAPSDFLRVEYVISEK